MCVCVCVYVVSEESPKGQRNSTRPASRLLRHLRCTAHFLDLGGWEWEGEGGRRRGEKLLVSLLVGCEDGWDGMGWGFLIDRSIGACLAIFLSFALLFFCFAFLEATRGPCRMLLYLVLPGWGK